MDHADMAQLAAVLGALGAALVLMARSRVALVAGFALLGTAEAGLGLALLGLGDALDALRPATAAALVGALVLLGGASALLARIPALVTPLLLAAAPFRPPLDFGTEHHLFVAIAEPGQLGRLLPLYGVLAAGVLALLFRALRGTAVPPLPTALALPAAAFFLLAALSTLWSWDVESSTKLLAFFLLPFAGLVAVVARTPFPAWLPRVLAVVALALASLFAAVGLWQSATHDLFFFSRNLEIQNTYLPLFRVTSLFRDPSLYGRHLVLGLCVVLVALWLRRIRLPLAAALVALLWAGLYVSYSQSSMVALFVVALAVAAVAGKRRGRQLAAVSTAALLLVGAGAVAATAGDQSARRITSDRSQRVRLAARVFRERPLGGVGVGAQPRASQKLSRRYGQTGRFVSHTAPLTVAAELGALGVAAYLALLAGAAALIDRVRRRDAALGLTLGAAFLALFVHALFYSGFFEDPITWLVLGIAAGYLAARETAAERPATLRSGRHAADSP